MTQNTPIAWMRRWYFDGVDVMALKKADRPAGWMLHAVTMNKVLSSDVALYVTPSLPFTGNQEASMVEHDDVAGYQHRFRSGIKMDGEWGPWRYGQKPHHAGKAYYEERALFTLQNAGGERPAPKVERANGPAALNYEASLHLNWIADRLEHVHGENPNYDYMQRLREIADKIKSPATPAPNGVSGAVRDIAAERERQVAVEGWTPEHDDAEHSGGQLAIAAACYAISAGTHDGNRHLLAAKRWTLYEGNQIVTAFYWLWYLTIRWSSDWWKPSSRRRDLVKAGALILAEIERLDRAALSQEPSPSRGVLYEESGTISEEAWNSIARKSGG